MLSEILTGLTNLIWINVVDGLRMLPAKRRSTQDVIRYSETVSTIRRS